MTFRHDEPVPVFPLRILRVDVEPMEVEVSQDIGD